MGENTIFLGIFDGFCPYLKNSSNYFDEKLRLNCLQCYLAPPENRMSLKNLVWAVQ